MVLQWGQAAKISGIVRGCTIPPSRGQVVPITESTFSVLSNLEPLNPEKNNQLLNIICFSSPVKGEES